MRGFPKATQGGPEGWVDWWGCLVTLPGWVDWWGCLEKKCRCVEHAPL